MVVLVAESRLGSRTQSTAVHCSSWLQLQREAEVWPQSGKEGGGGNSPTSDSQAAGQLVACGSVLFTFSEKQHTQHGTCHLTLKDCLDQLK